MKHNNDFKKCSGAKPAKVEILDRGPCGKGRSVDRV